MLDGYVTPSLHTGCMPLHTEQIKDSLRTKFNNLATLLHVVIKRVRSDFKVHWKLVTVAPQVSKVPGEAKSHKDIGLPTFYVKYDINAHIISNNKTYAK